MKKLGKVAIITKKGELLVKSTTTYRLNTKVVNQQIQNIGKIVDIIGPVETPYIVINTRNAEAQAKTGEQLYLIEKPTSSRPPSRSSNYKRKSSQKPRK